MTGALYRFGLLAASVGGAAMALCGMWLVTQDAPTVGRVMVGFGAALTIGAAGAAMFARAR